MNLFIKEISKYKHLVYKDIELPIISESLKNALSILDEPIVHPFYIISKDGIFIRNQYAWDGATYVLNDSKYLRIPSLIHDVGCQAVNNHLLDHTFRKHFDREYFELSLLYNPFKETFISFLVTLRACLHFTFTRLWGLIPKGKEKDKYANIYCIPVKEKVC